MSVVLRWGGASGPFSPQPENRSADSAYVAAAERLLSVRAPQPPTDLVSTVDTPVVSVMQTEVAGSRRWCFVYRGRGGAGFSRAGACWFVFDDGPSTALTAWRAGLQQFPDIDPTGRDIDLDDVHDACVQFLRAVIYGEANSVTRLGARQSVPVIIRAIESVLQALPAALAESYAWASYLLAVPPSDLRILTGEVPVHFAATPQGSRIREWQESIAPPRPSDDATERAIAWLADQAVDGAACVAPDALGVPAFVRTIIDHHLPLIAADVPRHFDAAPGLLLTRGRSALAQWVRENPWEAIGVAVGTRYHTDLRHAVTSDLVDLQDSAGYGENPAYFPPARPPEPTWEYVLADELARRHPTEADMRGYMLANVVGEGRPLYRFADRCNHDRWFDRLGIDQLREYGDPEHALAEQARRETNLSVDWVDALRRSTVGEQLLIDAVSRLEVTPAEAAVLARAAKRPSVIADEIVAHNRDRGHPVDSRWLNRFEQMHGPQPAVERFTEQIVLNGSGPVAPERLVRVVRQLANSPDATVAISPSVLRQLADLAEAPQSRGPVRDNAVRSDPDVAPRPRKGGGTRPGPAPAFCDWDGRRAGPSYYPGDVATQPDPAWPENPGEEAESEKKSGKLEALRSLWRWLVPAGWALAYLVFGFVVGVVVAWSFGKLG